MRNTIAGPTLLLGMITINHLARTSQLLGMILTLASIGILLCLLSLRIYIIKKRKDVDE